MRKGKGRETMRSSFSPPGLSKCLVNHTKLALLSPLPSLLPAALLFHRPKIWNVARANFQKSTTFSACACVPAVELCFARLGILHFVVSRQLTFSLLFPSSILVFARCLEFSRALSLTPTQSGTMASAAQMVNPNADVIGKNQALYMNCGAAKVGKVVLIL